MSAPYFDQVAVVGAGTMGNGIAHVFAQSGRQVTLIDVNAGGGRGWTEAVSPAAIGPSVGCEFGNGRRAAGENIQPTHWSPFLLAASNGNTNSNTSTKLPMFTMKLLNAQKFLTKKARPGNF